MSSSSAPIRLAFASFYALFLPLLLGHPSFAQSPKPSQAEIAIAFYQTLGTEDKAPKIFALIQKRLEEHHALRVMPMAEVQRRLGGDLGQKQLGSCRDLACMNAIAHQKLQTPRALLLNTGVLGTSFLLEMQLIDLADNNRVLHTISGKKYDSLEKFEKELPDLLSPFFPSYTRLVVEGSPEGASVLINGRFVGKLPKVEIKQPSGEATVEVNHPKHQTNTKRLTLLPKRQMILNIALLPLVVEKRIVAPPPPPPKAQAWYQQWWIWVIAGGVVAGATVGIVLGVQQGKVLQIQTPL
jgi:hypothetical protein